MTSLGHQAWEQAGHQIREYMGSKTLMLSTHDPLHKKADVVLTLGMTAQQVQEYGHFAQHDVWALGGADRRIFGKALVGEQVVDDDAFLGSYIYNEYLKPSVDARYMVGSLVRLQGGNHGAIGVHRPHDAKDFTLKDAERLNRLLPTCSAPWKSASVSGASSARRCGHLISSSIGSASVSS